MATKGEMELFRERLMEKLDGIEEKLDEVLERREVAVPLPRESLYEYMDGEWYDPYGG